MTGFDAAIDDRFGARVERQAPLAPLTTFKVGGPADFLLTVDSSGELSDAVRIARAHGVPVTVLGGGSNLLVADAGVKGLVVRLRRGDVQQIAVDAIRADGGLTINGLVRWTITHTAGRSPTSASRRIVPALQTTTSACWRRAASSWRSV